MRNLIPHFSFLILLSACGADEQRFRMEGEFKSFNQGELYVYSPDGGIRQLDTIAVKDGRFTYQIDLDTTATFVLVFPNYSEIPVIGASGTEVRVKGDASHLKEVEVKGTKENERLTAFRLSTGQLTPPEVVKQAAAFIKENPASLASLYLLNRHFIQTPQQDYQQAYALADTMLKAAPDNRRIATLKTQIEALKEDKRLPKFSTTDIKGRPVSSGDLFARVNVVTTWASWNFESKNIQRQLKRMEKQYGANRLKILSFCLDASDKTCQQEMDRDSITWSNVCDGRMWETPALTRLSMARVPDNIITDSGGKIIARSLNASELRQKIEELMK